MNTFQPVSLKSLVLLSIFLLLPVQTWTNTIQQETGPEKVMQNVRFRDASFRAAAQVLTKSMGLLIDFADSIKKDEKVTIELKNVSLKKALKAILEEKKYQARLMGENKIVIISNEEAESEKYRDLPLWPGMKD